MNFFDIGNRDEAEVQAVVAELAEAAARVTTAKAPKVGDDVIAGGGALVAFLGTHAPGAAEQVLRAAGWTVPESSTAASAPTVPTSTAAAAPSKPAAPAPWVTAWDRVTREEAGKVLGNLQIMRKSLEAQCRMKRIPYPELQEPQLGGEGPNEPCSCWTAAAGGAVVKHCEKLCALLGDDTGRPGQLVRDELTRTIERATAGSSPAPAPPPSARPRPTVEMLARGFRERLAELRGESRSPADNKGQAPRPRTAAEHLRALRSPTQSKL